MGLGDALFVGVGGMRRTLGVCVIVATAIALTAVAPTAASLSVASAPSATRPYYACPHSLCQTIVDPRPERVGARFRIAGSPLLLEGSGELGGYSPEDLASAYKFTKTGGKNVTVAVVDPYGYRHAASDLETYRETYGLKKCTIGGGCLKIVNQEGESSPLPPETNGDAFPQLEQAEDLDMVSAACPECHILLVEANRESISDLAESAAAAARLGATVVSNSWARDENSPECGAEHCAQYAADFAAAGVVFVAGSGDSGYDNGPEGSKGAPNFPASAPTVVAVGGTSLRRAANGRGWSETAWRGSGSGCSLVEPKPSWQSDSGCAKRTVADVAAVGDFETPVSVRWSRPEGEPRKFFGEWFVTAGTSAAAPIVAGMFAHAEEPSLAEGAEVYYLAPSWLAFDVTEGSNGECPAEAAYLCTAGIGYDGPTGWGSPHSIP